ncbi:G-alpha-domain-containing protein [Amylostereum chailletii]|nr:G-alpha-domain-containing protein [Amylostereum chailletii]
MTLRDRFKSRSPRLEDGSATPLPQVDLEQLDGSWPPSDVAQETPSDRNVRLESELEAKRINDAIDHELELERNELRKRKVNVKILLLGQAESGKSTMLRNFQLKFTPAAFHAEAEAWRAVIDLNLVRSVTFILNVLNEGLENGVTLSDQLRRLRVSLGPLRSVEEQLAKFLSPDDPAARVSQPGLRGFEVNVRSGSRWKSLFNRNAMATTSRSYIHGYEEVLNARRVIEACREDMLALWTDPIVRSALDKQSVSLQFRSGFFLDEVDRIARSGYIPSSSDILKARIQTMGVEEHHLRMETAAESGQTWSIIDVGGSRAQRAAWVPFFDDVNVLLFLAPVSAFDQNLSEDPTVNRLWDSFLLWKTVCANKLLRHVTFILLLNKSDILDAKLKAGTPFSHFVTSYRMRPNETEHVLIYLKEKFGSIYKQNATAGRLLHVHVTCATDSSAMDIVLLRVREVIFTTNFESADLL